MKAKHVPAELLADEKWQKRFWAGVSPSTDDKCWPWMRSCTGNGVFRYGQTRYKGESYKTHRIAFVLIKGYEPCVARHACDNPLCCNPSHIKDGTHKDNTQDMLKRGRCNPPVGARSGHAKLTDDVARQIKAEYRAGGTSYTKLASKYGVCFQLIGQLMQGKIWKHIL